MHRAAEWDISELPVPADLLVYSKDEWKSMKDLGRFYRTAMDEAVWIYWKGKSG